MNIKRVFFTIILIFIVTNFNNFGHAFDLDETVDDSIRKNYNPSKLNNDMGISVKNQSPQSNTQDEELPALPEILNGSSVKTTSKSGTVPPTAPIYKGGDVCIHKGTSFEVVNSASISDYQSSGTKVRFYTKSQINRKNYTLPSGTTFYGEIIESHQPQISCNGGLVVIRVHSMIYKGQTIPMKGYITRANEKKIFLNNIKGKRTYLKTVYQKGNWGRSIFSKMLTMTISLGGSGSTIALSPFPFAYGTICLGANTLFSPISAFFSKGGHVSIPAESKFKIKLLEDIYI